MDFWRTEEPENPGVSGELGEPGETRRPELLKKLLDLALLGAFKVSWGPWGHEGIGGTER